MAEACLICARVWYTIQFPVTPDPIPPPAALLATSSNPVPEFLSSRLISACNLIRALSCFSTLLCCLSLSFSCLACTYTHTDMYTHTHTHTHTHTVWQLVCVGCSLQSVCCVLICVCVCVRVATSIPACPLACSSPHLHHCHSCCPPLLWLEGSHSNRASFCSS